MTEQNRQDAVRREESLCQEVAKRRESLYLEALERERLGLATEQMLMQMRKEIKQKNAPCEQQAEERNAKREQLLLENEYKRQKVQAELQLEIEGQRAATETNQVIVQTEMLERKEVEHLVQKEKEKQKMIAMKEIEKLEMKSHFEVQLALERRLSEQKERNLRLEWQLKEQEERKEVMVRANFAPKPTASTASAPTIPSFAKTTLPPKYATKNVPSSAHSMVKTAPMDQGVKGVGALRLLPDGTHTVAYTPLEQGVDTVGMLMLLPDGHTHLLILHRHLCHIF